MNNRTLNIAALAIGLVFAAGPANAAFITGDISMSGDFAPTCGTDLGDATGIDFLGDDFTVDDANGDFAAFGIATGDIGFYQDFQFDPLTPSPVDPLWSIAGFSFALTDVVVSFQSPAFLVLEGTGTVAGNGFDVTNGSWILTANSAGTLFNFSSGATATAVDEPAVLGLLGLGLLAFGLRRRIGR